MYDRLIVKFYIPVKNALIKLENAITEIRTGLEKRRMKIANEALESLREEIQERKTEEERWALWVVEMCESDHKAGANLYERKWTGETATRLFEMIIKKHGKLWSAHTSRENLLERMGKSIDNPNEILWTNSFIRELALSALGLNDTGIYHT